jgi:hypothetical protein
MPETKCIYVLNVDNYNERIREITYPTIKAYAKRIGADFLEISRREFPGWPPVYEKLQISRRAKTYGFNWNIYIDSDCLVHPDTPDFTLFMSKDTVAHINCDMAALRFRYDQYFKRDGRNIGSANWFTIASDMCLDLWRPLDDLTLEEAVANIKPTSTELAHGIKAEHLIDDYTLSRNIARFGLKFTTVSKILERLGMPGVIFFYHQYTLTEDQKIAQMLEVQENWRKHARGEIVEVKK